MKTTRNLIILAVIAIAGVAGAQTVRHDRMDAHAAARDIARLRVDRARAMHHHNWKKVRQDDRLIAADRRWIRRDARKIHRAQVGW